MDRFLLFVGVIGLLLACKPITAPTPATGPIPFETLALNDSGVDIKASETSKDSQLQVINDIEQAMALEPTVRPEDFRLLLEVDYENYAVIALFRGWQGSSNYQTVIQRLLSKNTQLLVEAEFWSPSPQWESAAEMTYPYHLITIARKDLPSAPISLQLEATMLTPTPPAK